MSTKCSAPEKYSALGDYAFGVLDESEAALLEEHFVGCFACQERLGALQWAAEALRPDAGGLIDALRPQSREALGKVVAQALATLRSHFHTFLQQGLLPEALLLERGESTGTGKGLREQCADLIRAGDFAGALAALGCGERLEITQLTGGDCWRAGALAHEAGRLDESLVAFERAVSTATHHPWYRWSAALAALELGHTRIALEHLRAVCAQPGPLASSARQIASEFIEALTAAHNLPGGDGE